MILWPFKPLRDYPETLGWLTDVLRAKSAEQRIAMRTAPRFTVAYQFLMSASQFSRAQSMARFLGAQSFYLPLWSDVAVFGAINSGVSVLPVDTRYADYRVGGKLVLWQSDSEFEICTIDAKTSGTITLTDPTAQSFSSAIVAPIVAAQFIQPFEASRRGGRYIQAQAAIVSTDAVDLSVGNSYTEYRGAPVMTDRVRLLGNISERFERENISIDNDTGLIDQVALYDYAIKGSMMNWQPWTRPDLWALRQWLHYCRGRQRGFWLPSWNNDLQLTADITSGGSTITVQAVGYPDFETVRDIMIEDTSGNRYYRRINSGVEGGGNTEVLTLSAAAGINLTVAQVRRISYLTYMRNNADRIEIQHYAPGKATVSVPVMEAPAP
jgi:hypothetical protein